MMISVRDWLIKKEAFNAIKSKQFVVGLETTEDKAEIAFLPPGERNVVYMRKEDNLDFEFDEAQMRIACLRKKSWERMAQKWKERNSLWMAKFDEGKGL
jgi:hypothetical protein